MENWKTGVLGDFITLQRGFDLPEYDRLPGIFPVVTSSGIGDFHNEAKVKGPGVVMGRYGTIGTIYFVEQDFWPHNTTLFVKDFKGNNPHFISYFLRTLNYQAHNDKSSVPGLNRNHLHLIPVKLPPLPEQRAIAEVLGSLDDKIALNRRMNQTLEALSQAIFKSWFIDFDPVRAKMEGRPLAGIDAEMAALFPDAMDGDVPTRWRKESLDQIAHFLNGLALQKYPPTCNDFLPVIKIAQLRTENIEGADKASASIPKEYIVENGNILFSWSGSLDVVIWCGGKGALNQHLFKVTSSKYPKWFYYHWILHHLPVFQAIAAGKATTMGHIQRHHLSEAKVIVPDTNLLREMDQVIAPFLEKIILNKLESHNLANLRDSLLPKLLSGEVKVDTLDNQSEL